jgi:hypothetical protein
MQFYTKIMDLGDYTMVKERGTRTDEGGMKIA